MNMDVTSQISHHWHHKDTSEILGFICMNRRVVFLQHFFKASTAESLLHLHSALRRNYVISTGEHMHMLID